MDVTPADDRLGARDGASEHALVQGGGVLTRWRSWSPYLLSALRIIAAFLFMQVGTAKLFAFPAGIMPEGGTAPVASLAGIAGILETFGGLLLLLGLFTRPVAFVLSGEMAVAYFIGHAGMGFWPVLNQGIPAIMFCFVWLYLSAAGPGPWSLDAVLRRRSPPAA
jgi:putative oxidoreductase